MFLSMPLVSQRLKIVIVLMDNIFQFFPKYDYVHQLSHNYQ